MDECTEESWPYDALAQGLVIPSQTVFMQSSVKNECMGEHYLDERHFQNDFLTEKCEAIWTDW